MSDKQIKDRPEHSRETKFTGELQEFSGTSLPVDDPSVQARARRKRPAPKTHNLGDGLPPSAEQGEGCSG